MISITFFLWFDPVGKYNSRYAYSAEHVNHIKRAVHKHLTLPHEFVVVSDRHDGFDPDIRIVDINRSLIRDGKRWPKLMIYRPDAGQLIGKRILMLDIDAEVHASLDPLVDRSEDFVGWQNPNTARLHTVMNSSMTLLTAGSRPEVWESFDIDEATEFAIKDRRGGSDQAHVSRILGDREAMWSAKDGVYWSRQVEGELPANARIVFYAGWGKPARMRPLPARFTILESMVNERGWARGAELGLLAGNLFFHLLDRCSHLSLIGVDAWRYADNINVGHPGHCNYRMFPLEQHEADVFARAAAYGDRASIRKETTVAAAAAVPDGTLDFVFIDADHTEPAVRLDIVNWAPKLKPSGWLMGHDYSDKFPGVKAAVDDLAPGRVLLDDDVWAIERVRLAC